MRSFLKFWFPFLGYSVIIFCISSLPADRVTFTRFFWDKGLHMLEYFPLGISAAYALTNTWRLPAGAKGESALAKAGPLGLIWVVSAALCFLYGLSDEFHQGFVPGREVSIYDALADLAGAVFGAGTYLFVCNKDKSKAYASH